MTSIEVERPTIHKCEDCFAVMTPKDAWPCCRCVNANMWRWKYDKGDKLVDPGN